MSQVLVRAWGWAWPRGWARNGEAKGSSPDEAETGGPLPAVPPPSQGAPLERSSIAMLLGEAGLLGPEDTFFFRVCTSALLKRTEKALPSWCGTRQPR